MMKAIFLNGVPGLIERIYAERQMNRLKTLVDLDETVYASADDLRRADVRDAELIFSTWGMVSLTEDEIKELLPNLKAVFYAAGSVQGFARPFLNSGVRVFSGWHANGKSVAQYTFSQIILASKGFFRTQPVMREKGRQASVELHRKYPGCYDMRVGLLGCGAIGSLVAKMLKDTDCEVWVFDPFLPKERADELNVKLAGIDDIFENCLIVSNHLANLPTTQGIIKRRHFMSMLPYSTFINTGRGAQLDENDLMDALIEDPTRTALLDVRNGEPDTDDHPITQLSNCIITPHIAGASGHEVRRMADYMMDAYEQMEKGEKIRCEVNLRMLETMA